MNFKTRSCNPIFLQSTEISDEIAVEYDSVELKFSEKECSKINDCTESCLEMKASANGRYLSATLLSIAMLARFF